MITKKKFEEAYQTIVKDSMPFLEMYRKKAVHEYIKTAEIIIGTLFIGIVLSICTGIALFMAMSIVFIIAYIGKKMFSTKNISANVQYKKEYKERVVEKLLSFFDEALKYTPDRGLPSSIYSFAGFQLYDRYHTEDLISGKIEEQFPFSMSELLIQSESTDSEGKTTYTTRFQGLFSMIENDKNIHSTIYIKNDKKFGKNAKFRGTKLVPLDSLEFEKIFDIYSDNAIITAQIMTSEIMQMLNEMYQQMKFEISIVENKIFMRFSLKENLFEASYKKEIVSKEKLYRYCQIINFTMELFLKLHNAIEETQI